MKCRDYEDLIALWAGGDLSQDEARQVESHVAACEACRAFANEMQECRAALAGLREAPPMSVRAAVMERVARPQRSWMWLWKPAAAGFAAAAAGFVVWLQGIDTRIPPPPAAPVVRAAVPAEGLEFAPRPEPKPRVVARSKPQTVEPQESFMVKLITDDPDVVIYWLFAKRGD
jgi:anti-sigma factor RsiW